MLTEQKLYLEYIQLVSDMLCLFVVYYLFLPLFVSTNFIFAKMALERIPFSAYGIFFITIPPVFVALLKGYTRTAQHRLLSSILSALLLAVVSFIVLCILSSVMPGNWQQWINYALVSTALLFCLLLLCRAHNAWLLKNPKSTHHLVKHFLVAGTGSLAREMAQYIVDHPEFGLRINGFLTDQEHETGQMINGCKVLGHVSDLIQIIHSHYTDGVLIPGPNLEGGFHEALVKNCTTIGLDLAFTDPDMQPLFQPREKIIVEHIGNYDLVLVKFVYQNTLSCFIKRVFDFSAASALIVACLPLWITIACAIKTTSPGPVFFRQTRLGKYGKRFTLFKFRSMYQGAEKMQKELQYLNEMDGPAFKIKNDPRLTRVGIFLRKTSLDELPQLFNVFLGDISLVGPRPAIEAEVAQYRPMERKRMAVEQGITCIWQISGRNDIKFDEWMKLDQLYIEYWSPAQDLKILFRTVPAVLLKKGAY